MTEEEQAEFEATGYLSPLMASFRERVRAELSNWFGVADDVSFALQRTAHRNVERSTRGQMLRGQKPVAQTVMFRSIGNLQGTIIMAERGMIAEARTLARSVLENAFCMAALHDDPAAFLEHLETDHALSRKGHANAILKLGDTTKFNEAEIREAIEKIPKMKNLGMAGLSEKGPLGAQYLAYRVLSNDGAHPSATSLARHLDMTSDRKGWKGYRVGPEGNGRIVESLNFALLAALPIGVAYTQIMGDAEGNAEFAALSDRYSALPHMNTLA